MSVDQFPIGVYVKGVNHKTGRTIRGKVVASHRHALDVVGSDHVVYVLTPQQFHITLERELAV